MVDLVVTLFSRVNNKNVSLNLHVERLEGLPYHIQQVVMVFLILLILP